MDKNIRGYSVAYLAKVVLVSPALLLTMIMTAGFLTAIPAQAGELAFTVQEPSGVERVGWPVQGGVPFAKGALKESDAVALFDADGKAIPVQTATLTKWYPDDSVKWLLLDFFADVPSSGVRTYTLKYGADAQSPPARSPLKAKKTGEVVSIDTGVLRAKIGPRFIHSLSVRDEGGQWKELVSEPGELWMTVDGQNEGRYAASFDETATVEIEEQGPNRVAVLVKGVHTSHDGRAFGPYILRVHAYAGKPWLRVFHTFINSDLPERGLITGIGMRVPFEYDSGSSVSYGGLTEEAKGGWPGWIEEVDGDRQVVVHDGQHRDLEERLRAYLAVSSDKGSMACLGRHWRQLFPKKMDIAANGLTVWFWPASRGAFDLRREEQKHTKRWADYKKDHPKLYKEFHDPGTIRSAGINMRRRRRFLENGDLRAVAMSSALGISRTHEMFFCFGAGPIDESELNRMSDSVEHALIPWAPAGYVSATEVLGPFGARNRKDFPLTENYLELKLDWIIRHQNEWARWWGVLDWGGLRSFYQELHKVFLPGRWHEMAGRAGWRNAEVDTPQSVLFSYLRTGNPRYWRFFESTVRHMMDVDTVHANPPEYDRPGHRWIYEKDPVDGEMRRAYSGAPDGSLEWEEKAAQDYLSNDHMFDLRDYVKGGMHRHSYHHYGGAVNDQHTWNEALANYHYLTGDRRAREVALEAAEFNYGAPLGQVKSAFEINHDHPFEHRRYDRNAINCWRTSLKAYELTGDPFWKADVDRWREHYLKGFVDFIKTEKVSSFKTNHYMAQTALVDYYMSRDKRVGDMIVGIAQWNIDYMKNNKSDRGLHYPFLACAIAWRISHDNDLLRWPYHAYLTEWRSDRVEAVHDDFRSGQFYEYYQLPFFLEACREAGFSETKPPESIPENIDFPPLKK